MPAMKLQIRLIALERIQEVSPRFLREVRLAIDT